MSAPVRLWSTSRGAAPARKFGTSSIKPSASHGAFHAPSMRGERERSKLVCHSGHGLPQDTPLPKRSTGSWKPKKRRGEDIRDPEHVEKVVIPVAKKPITKSYVAQTILGSASAFAAIAFVLLPDLAASAVFGLGDIAHMTRPMVTLVGALLGFKATLFLVLRELSYSYSSTKTGYLGVCASSLVAIRAIAFAAGPVGLGQVVVGALALFSLGTALVQLKKIHQFKPSSSSL